MLIAVQSGPPSTTGCFSSITWVIFTDWGFSGAFCLNPVAYQMGVVSPSRSMRSTVQLAAVQVPHEAKSTLRAELERVGIDEMTIFPEFEHACAHLIRRARLWLS
jgi:hypothetical protein